MCDSYKTKNSIKEKQCCDSNMFFGLLQIPHLLVQFGCSHAGSALRNMFFELLQILHLRFGLGALMCLRFFGVFQIAHTLGALICLKKKSERIELSCWSGQTIEQV